MVASNTVSTTLASATETSLATGRDLDVHLYDSSSFDGTWQIQRVINNRDCVVAEGTEADLPYDKVIENATARGVKVVVTTYTSGTLGVEIG